MSTTRHFVLKKLLLPTIALCALLLALSTLHFYDATSSQQQRQGGIAAQKVAVRHLETTEPFASRFDQGWTATVVYRGTGVTVVLVTSDKKNAMDGQSYSAAEVVVDVDRGVVLKATAVK